MRRCLEKGAVKSRTFWDIFGHPSRKSAESCISVHSRASAFTMRDAGLHLSKSRRFTTRLPPVGVSCASSRDGAHGRLADVAKYTGKRVKKFFRNPGLP